jgi:hypothetical protein
VSLWLKNPTDTSPVVFGNENRRAVFQANAPGPICLTHNSHSHRAEPAGDRSRIEENAIRKKRWRLSPGALSFTNRAANAQELCQTAYEARPKAGNPNPMKTNTNCDCICDPDFISGFRTTSPHPIPDRLSAYRHVKENTNEASAHN